MRILAILLLSCSLAWAEATEPPVIQDATVQQQQYLQDLYANQNIPRTVTVNPNGTRYGNYGQIVRYFDGSSYELFTCISSPNGKSWQSLATLIPITHSLPAGGTASQALVKLSAIDYDTGWNTILAPPPQFISAYVKVSEVQANTTAGGTFTQDAWRTRVINTEDSDTGNNCTVAGNQITLLAGTYECFISAPAFNVNNCKAQLYNITATATTLMGGNDVASGSGSRSIVAGRFTIAVDTTFEVQHYCQTTQAATGFGTANSFGVDEVFTIAEFWREG